jgi:hypothetical protein
MSDTTTWLPLDGLARGFDANKAQPSGALASRSVQLIDGAGGHFSVRFTANEVTWREADGDTGTDTYEAFEVDRGLHYVQWHPGGRPVNARSLFLDTEFGRALLVAARIGVAAPGKTAVQHEFLALTVDGIEPSGPEPAPTTALIGRRALWVYSPEHAYEHVYLSPHWYTWQCLAGPERGQADTDENTLYELRKGIYVFAWREKVIPCGAVTVADHRDANALRSHGYLFGLDETGTRPVHFTFGAHGRLLSTTLHPEDLYPA